MGVKFLYFSKDVEFWNAKRFLCFKPLASTIADLMLSASAGKTQVSSKRLTKKQPLGNAERSLYKNSHLEAVRHFCLAVKKKYIMQWKISKKKLCCFSTEKKKHFLVGQWGKTILAAERSSHPPPSPPKSNGLLPHDL